MKPSGQEERSGRKERSGRQERRTAGRQQGRLPPPVPRGQGAAADYQPPLFLGLDIGGTGLKAGIVDSRGRLVAHLETPTRAQEGRDGILRRLLDLARAALARSTEPVAACGAGSAGRIDFPRGVVHFATGNLPGWTGLDLAGALQGALGVPSFVDNDVNAAALAESWIGAAAGAQDFVMLTVGTGVGAAVCIRGELWRGANWGAGEVGHTVLYPGGQPCNCGGAGCAEQYISARALTRRANEAQGGGPPFRGIREVLGAASNAGSSARQQAARSAVAAYVKDMALFMVNIQNAYDPRLIIVGGGILKMGYWWPKLEEALEREAKARSLAFDLRPAACGPHAGVIGAARLAMLCRPGG
jgi:glucokinase